MKNKKIRYIPIVAFWTRPLKGVWEYFSVGYGSIASIHAVEGGYDWNIFSVNTNQYSVKSKICGFSLKLREAKQTVEIILSSSGTAIKKITVPLILPNKILALPPPPLALPPPVPKLKIENAEDHPVDRKDPINLPKRLKKRQEIIRSAFRPTKL